MDRLSVAKTMAWMVVGSCCLLLLLCPGVQSASSHASHDKVLVEKLQQARASARAKSLSKSLSRARETLLLQEHEVIECALLGPYFLLPSQIAFTTTLTCAQAEQHGQYKDTWMPLGSGAGSVGSCTWTINYYPTGQVPVHNAPSVRRAADVRAICTLTGGVEECGGPGCEQMVIDLQGHLYSHDKVASHTATPIHQIGVDSGSLGFTAPYPSCCMLNLAGLPPGSAHYPESCAKWPGPRLADHPAGNTPEAARAFDTIWDFWPSQDNSRDVVIQADTQPGAHTTNTYEEDDIRPIYYGNSIIASGIATIATIGADGKETVEETGLFEYPLFTNSTLLAANERVPSDGVHWIHPNALKLTLFKEEAGGDTYGRYAAGHAN